MEISVVMVLDQAVYSDCSCVDSSEAVVNWWVKVVMELGERERGIRFKGVNIGSYCK